MAQVDDALGAAAEGFRVIPIPPGSKGPTLAGWPERATTNEATIRRWFAETPKGNYGLAMGAGLLAVDLDVKGADGRATLEAIEAELGPLPPTRAHRTPSGGRHLIFRVPEGVDFANAVNVEPGVDLRSAGGQIVGPGSSTMAGFYAVEVDAPIAYLPANYVVRWQTKAPAPASRTYDAAPAEDHELLTDGRKEWLRDRVWQLRRIGLGEAAIVAALDVEAPLRIADADRYAGEIRRLARNVVRRDPGVEERASGLTGADLREFRRLGMDDEEAAADVRAERRDAFRVRGMRALMTEPAPEPLVGPWLPQSALAVIYGPPHAGKSLIAIEWALCVASGLDFYGLGVERGHVVYVLGEGRLQERVTAWEYGRWRGRGGDPLEGLAVHADGFRFTDEAAVAGLVEYARTSTPALVVFDTLARTLGDDENASQAVARVLDAYDGVRSVSPRTTVLLVAHPGKDADKGIRGHSSLTGAADVIIRAVGSQSEAAASSFVAGAATGGWVRISSEKNKDGGRVASSTFCLRSDTHSVYLDEDRSGIANRPTVPPSRQGGRGVQQTGGVD